MEEAGYYWYFKIHVSKDNEKPHETFFKKIELDLIKNKPN
jgi:hypothetical protein